MDKGFTLIEMIVALGIFAVVAVVALGALVKIIAANKKAQSLQSALTDLNYALESMSREIRVGSTIYCSPSFNGSISPSVVTASSPCLVTDNGGHNRLVAFQSTKSDSSGTCRLVYAYAFFDSAISGQYILKKAKQTFCSDATSNLDFTPVVSSNVAITDYRLGVSNQPYPLTFIRLSGYAGIRERDKTYFNVQTSVSSRIP